MGLWSSTTWKAACETVLESVSGKWKWEWEFCYTIRYTVYGIRYTVHVAYAGCTKSLIRLFGFWAVLRCEQRGCVALMAADALRYPFPGGAKQSKLGPLGGGLPVDHLSRRQSIYTAHSLPTCPLAHFHGAH